MALPPEVDTEVRAQLEAWCDLRSPAELRDEMRVEFKVRGNDVTIYERRAPWHPDVTDWTSAHVARLRYDHHGEHWSLLAPTAGERWLKFDDLVEPSPRPAVLLAVIDADPTGHFWG